MNMAYENVVFLHEKITKRVTNLRKFTRKPFRRATIFACQNRYYAGLTQNISKGGVFIETRNRFSAGQIVKLVISHTKIEKASCSKAKLSI